MALFWMVVPERPKSQSGHTSAYRERVRKAARATAGTALLNGRLYARVIWFYRRHRVGDVDNLVKPILDSLKGVVFNDDREVAECQVVAVDLDRSYRFLTGTDQDALLAQADIDRQLQTRSNPADWFYVEIGNGDEPALVVGAPTGGST